MSAEVIPVIKRCIAGDEEAWNIFCNAYSGIAMNILNRHFSSLALNEKEDVIQNVFTKLFRGGLRNFNGNSEYEFLAYFKVIVRNKANSHITSEKRNNETISINQERDGDGQQLEIPDESPGPDIHTEGKELLGCVKRVLKDHPVVNQQVFMMKIKEYKDREIADILGISIGTVASKYSRIRDMLRQECCE